MCGWQVTCETLNVWSHRFLPACLAPAETTGRRDHQSEALRGTELPLEPEILGVLGCRGCLWMPLPASFFCLFVFGALFSVRSSSWKGCLHTCSWLQPQAGACCRPHRRQRPCLSPASLSVGDKAALPQTSACIRISRLRQSQHYF